ILERISEFLRKRGMNVSQKKTKVTAVTRLWIGCCRGWGNKLNLIYLRCKRSCWRLLRESTTLFGSSRSDDTASKQEVNPTNTQCNN
ncbi:hypothetical protein, partial [Nostoc sp. 'Peltigera membranacea cyanobiont' 213]|uniref:hypothetical protein n=1 Tax=Nostoc sp. 'Peltigera membranacea cyanobiont' 213 TaxID=2014530 RepID=UPI001CB98D9B